MGSRTPYSYQPAGVLQPLLCSAQVLYQSKAPVQKNWERQALLHRSHTSGGRWSRRQGGPTPQLGKCEVSPCESTNQTPLLGGWLETHLVRLSLVKLQRKCWTIQISSHVGIKQHDNPGLPAAAGLLQPPPRLPFAQSTVVFFVSE